MCYESDMQDVVNVSVAVTGTNSRSFVALVSVKDGTQYGVHVLVGADGTLFAGSVMTIVRPSGVMELDVNIPFRKQVESMNDLFDMVEEAHKA